MENKYIKDDILISDHGIIGNTITMALIDSNGTIDFMCFPVCDSPTVFVSFLDAEKGGFFSITPKNIKKKIQLYVPYTNVLVTQFICSTGIVELIDFMPVSYKKTTDNSLIRRIKVLKGYVECHVCLSPKFNYAQQYPQFAKIKGGILIKDPNNKQNMYFQSNLDIKCLDNGLIVSDIRLEANQIQSCLLSHYQDVSSVNATILSEEHIYSLYHHTVTFWKSWSSKSSYVGPWKRDVNRSALTLKLLTNNKYGSILAAPTFGFPETIGGERNWDYRYAWIRDMSLAVESFIQLNYREEAKQFLQWLEKRFTENIKENGLDIFYDHDGLPVTSQEITLNLCGYKASRPVRIGNEASNQLQLDIYGPLLNTIHLYCKHVGPITTKLWNMIVQIIEYIFHHWQEKDNGIWEARSQRQHHLYSQLMCWVAVGKAINISVDYHLVSPLARWKKLKTQIYDHIMNNFWNDEIKSFTQIQHGSNVDASSLFLLLSDFLSFSDIKWTQTLKKIQKDLIFDAFVLRYSNQDGLKGVEGYFGICSFWYISCLAKMGCILEAELLFQKMTDYSNQVGLFSEEFNSEGEQLGNFPQAFTHIGLIQTALALKNQN